MDAVVDTMVDTSKIKFFWKAVNRFQSWALSVFFNIFNNKKLFLAFFIKVTWLGVGFLNRTGAEIVY